MSGHQRSPADTRYHFDSDECHISLTVPKIGARTSPVEDEDGAVQFDVAEVDVVERTGQGVGVPG